MIGRDFVCKHCKSEEYEIQDGVVRCSSCGAINSIEDIVNDFVRVEAESTADFLKQLIKDRHPIDPSLLMEAYDNLYALNIKNLREICNQLMEEEPSAWLGWFLTGELLSWTSGTVDSERYDNAIGYLLRSAQIVPIEYQGAVFNIGTAVIKRLNMICSLQSISEIDQNPKMGTYLRYIEQIKHQAEKEMVFVGLDLFKMLPTFNLQAEEDNAEVEDNPYPPLDIRIRENAEFCASRNIWTRAADRISAWEGQEVQACDLEPAFEELYLATAMWHRLADVDEDKIESLSNKKLLIAINRNALDEDLMEAFEAHLDAIETDSPYFESLRETHDKRIEQVRNTAMLLRNELSIRNIDPDE